MTLAEIVHRGGVTYGIRVEADGGSVAYLPDHAPAEGSAGAEVLADGVDLLLHDGQFLPSKQANAAAFGHATLDEAISFADRCGERRLVLTHHAPTRTDDGLDAIGGWVSRSRGSIVLARQGDVLSVGPTCSA